MNILFLSLLDFDTFSEKNIYSDLLREFIKRGHKIHCISPVEKRKCQETHLLKFDDNCILKLKIGNTQKTNIIEKGISTLTLEPIIKHAIKKYFCNVKFDLVIYSTPPITFCSVIEYVKKRDGAKSYLLLKDIFPQNALDLGMFSKNNPIYKYFRKKEKKLYKISDFIGCMSKANVDYLIKHNSEIPKNTIEICPNSIEISDKTVSREKRDELRKKYGLPEDKTVFVYGGNLGKPQGVDFMIKALKYQAENKNAFFLIVGSGTEYKKLENYVNSSEQKNIKLLSALPKYEYDFVVSACDAGLIFLDFSFTIPNFPSRLLSYLESKLPVLVCTDTVCDMGKIAEENGFGIYCPSNDISNFSSSVEKILSSDLEKMGQRGYNYLCNNYSVKESAEIILKHF